MNASHATVRGVRLSYEIINPDGHINMVVTPGGQSGSDGARQLATALVKESSGRLRILIWDRRNMNKSDVAIGAADVLPIEEANDLRALLDHLNFWPVSLFGCSSGASTSLLMVSRGGSGVRSLVLAPVTGGAVQRV